jgi:YbgC/YbaW family acyl-CoA thioester hydrolase
MHQTQYKIRSTQVDSFGHLNNAAYLELYEWARWEWGEASGLDHHEMVHKRKIGPAILHIDLTFSKEIRLHETVTVRTWFHKAEKAKAVVAQEMLRSTGEIASKALIEFVMFNLEDRRAVPLPDDMRALYEKDADYRRSLEEDGLVPASKALPERT